MATIMPNRSRRFLRQSVIELLLIVRAFAQRDGKNRWSVGKRDAANLTVGIHD
jgi:hypothetical protein